MWLIYLLSSKDAEDNHGDVYWDIVRAEQKEKDNVIFSSEMSFRPF
jgi:hypothetical protein